MTKQASKFRYVAAAAIAALVIIAVCNFIAISRSHVGPSSAEKCADALVAVGIANMAQGKTAERQPRPPECRGLSEQDYQAARTTAAARIIAELGR